MVLSGKLNHKGFIFLCLALFFIFAALIPQVKAWEQANFEILILVDELEKAEGKDTTFYSWLNVKPSATPAEIGKAYKKMSLKLHPDKNKQDKKAKERFARLGKVAAILRNKGSRERYNFFYKNGVPRWRGTGYYYARFRPGVGSVIVFLFLVSGGMQHMAQWINYHQEKRKILQFVQDARENLSMNAPKGHGAPTLGRSFLELGHGMFRCEIKSDHYIIVHMSNNKEDEPVHLNTEWVYPPRITDVYLIKWPMGLVNKVLGRKQDQESDDGINDQQDDSAQDSGDYDDGNEDDNGKSDKNNKKDKKKKKVKSEPVNITGTKVGGRRRAIKK
ncbi:unnamed protein product [Cunninghamella echinulata]